MLDEFETRPHHFLYPTIIALIGGFFARLEGWEVIGWIVILISAVNTAWLFYHSKRQHELKAMQEEHIHFAEIMKLDESKKKTKVVIDKTALNGSPYQNFTEVKIAPFQLKRFAHGVLVEGLPMTIREWTPKKKGKPFSDPDWRRLIEFMKHPDWEDKRLRFIVPINPANENDGFELTAAGRAWLENVLEDSVVSVGSPD
jgi:hypothetical protein